MEQFNPLSTRLDEQETELAALRASVSELSEELAWHEHFDADTAIATVKGAPGAIAELDRQIAEVRAAMDTQEARVKLALPISAMGKNPLHWFSEARSKAKAEVAGGSAEFLKLKTQKATLAEEREALRQSADDAGSSIERHSMFDSSAVEATMAELQAAIDGLSAEIERLRPRVEAVDAALEPVLREYKKAHRRVSELESDMETVNRYQDRLARASDSKERWEIHHECESRFGDGKPGKVADKIRKELPARRSERTKLERRLRDIARRSSLDVDSLVIDGSNLVYEGVDFIGLFALRALCAQLTPNYPVQVIFDTSIRRKLGHRGDATIYEQLSGLDIHVMGSKEAADELILDTAQARTAYVISNDRFADFPDKSAVQEGRVIGHEIFNGHVIVRGLGIDVEYSREKN
ncbi:hypothetical protein AB0N59_02140 [Microbacterium sp. NPDC089321]|uniref:hypothetical protein n=1 Tax=Microbacterium sp. NPDC089321 TaxID=3155183 RepID=UPI00342A99E0